MVGEYRKSFDVTRAVAGHDGPRLQHRVTTKGKPSRKALILAINTKGSRASDPEFFVTRKGVFKAGREGFSEDDPVAPARATRTNRRTISLTFTPKSLRKPDSYGWKIGFFDGQSIDSAPNLERRFAVHDLTAE